MSKHHHKHKVLTNAQSTRESNNASVGHHSSGGIGPQQGDNTGGAIGPDQQGHPRLPPIKFVGKGVRYGRVLLETVDLPKLHVEAMVGGLVKQSGGTGGWTLQERRRRTPLTTFSGTPSRQLVIPILFDRYAGQHSVESHIHELEDMSHTPQGEDQPPRVKIDGGGAIPFDYTRNPDIDWVIGTDMEFGDYELNSAGKRCRQLITVTFYEFIPDDVIRHTKKHHKHHRRKKHPKHYTVKKGDTLQSIAKHFYGDRDKWKVIAERNHIRDPSHLKKWVGKEIKLP